LNKKQTANRLNAEINHKATYINNVIGGGSFPLTIETEGGGGVVGMRPEKDLVAAQCATEWTQRFAFQLTLLAL